MELKKSRRVNLERKRGSFFFIGLLFATAGIGMAFEYQSLTEKETQLIENFDAPHIISCGFPIIDPIPPEDEPKAIPPVIIEEPTIVDDDEEIEEIDILFTDEFTDEWIFEEYDKMSVIEEYPIYIPEVDPEFPGGDKALYEWLNENLEYPESAIDMGLQGMVYVQFVVEKDGTIEDVKVVKGISEDLDKEARRAIKKMPNWIPGEQGGKKVGVYFTIPIRFDLK